MNKKSLGPCPICNAPVYESERGNFYCSNKDCSFILFKNHMRFDDTLDMNREKVQILLHNGSINEKIHTLKGFEVRKDLILQIVPRNGVKYVNLNIVPEAIEPEGLDA